MGCDSYLNKISDADLKIHTYNNIISELNKKKISIEESEKKFSLARSYLIEAQNKCTDCMTIDGKAIDTHSSNNSKSGIGKLIEEKDLWLTKTKNMVTELVNDINIQTENLNNAIANRDSLISNYQKCLEDEANEEDD